MTMKDTPDCGNDTNTDDIRAESVLAATHLATVNRINAALREVSRAATPAADAGDKALAAVLAMRFVQRDLQMLQDQIDWLAAEITANAVGL